MKRLTLTLTASAIALAIGLIVLGPGSAAPSFAQVSDPAQTGPLSQDTVRALQNALSKQGLSVAVDGVLSESTRAAIRQYQSQHHLPVTGEPDKATLDKLGVVAGQRSTSQQPGGGMPTGQAAPGMGGMGMMSPEMIQMMMSHMMGGSGMGGMGMMGGSPGQGMPMGMGAGRMQGSGPMAVMPSLLYGTPSAELTSDRVKEIIEGLVASHGNPRLKVGNVSMEGSEIFAEIVTQDGSLVQKLAFNRYPGIVRQVP